MNSYCNNCFEMGFKWRQAITIIPFFYIKFFEKLKGLEKQTWVQIESTSGGKVAGLQ